MQTCVCIPEVEAFGDEYEGNAENDLETDLHEAVIQSHGLLGIFKGLAKATEHHEGGCPVPVVTGIFGARILK